MTAYLLRTSPIQFSSLSVLRILYFPCAYAYYCALPTNTIFSSFLHNDEKNLFLYYYYYSTVRISCLAKSISNLQYFFPWLPLYFPSPSPSFRYDPKFQSSLLLQVFLEDREREMKQALKVKQFP